MASILVIDDDPAITTKADETLSRAGHLVMTAASGKSGLKLVDRIRFDLIITSVIMPDMDGIEVILNLQQRERHPPIIAMTCPTEWLGQDYLDSIVSCFAIEWILHKPFTDEALLKVVQAAGLTGIAHTTHDRNEQAVLGQVCAVVGM